MGAWNLSTRQQRAPAWPAANKNLGAESHEFPQVAAFQMCLSSLLGKLSESCVSPLTRDSRQLESWVLILMTWCELTWWAGSVEYIKALVRRRHSGASGACPLGEVTRQWHLRHPLGAKYRLLHFAPPIMMKGRENLGFGGGIFHTWGPCRDTYTRWLRRLSAVNRAMGRKGLCSRASRCCLTHKTQQVPGTTGSDTEMWRISGEPQ